MTGDCFLAENTFQKHNYNQDILNLRVEENHLVVAEKNDEVYYFPTEKNKSIW